MMAISSIPRSLLLFSLGVALGMSATYIVGQVRQPDIGGEEREEDIVDGVEGLIGSTKLVRIRSLSKATGCEILAKAEVLGSLSCQLNQSF